MKKILLCFFMGAVSLTLSAQTDTYSSEVTAAVEALTALYGLDVKQVEKMEVIQERRFKNLADIAFLKDKDRAKYLHKLLAVRQGTEASMRMMFTKPQMQVFNQQQTQRRITESEIIKELKAKGVSNEEIRLLVIEKTN